MPDVYELLRSMPFTVVVEALGFDPQTFKTRKNGQEWYGKCPIHTAKSNNTSFSYSHGGDNSFTDWAEADGLLFVTNRLGVMHCFAPAGVALPGACTPTSTSTFTVSPTYTATPSATHN